MMMLRRIMMMICLGCSWVFKLRPIPEADFPDRKNEVYRDHEAHWLNLILHTSDYFGAFLNLFKQIDPKIFFIINRWKSIGPPSIRRLPGTTLTLGFTTPSRSRWTTSCQLAVCRQQTTRTREFLLCFANDLHIFINNWLISQVMMIKMMLNRNIKMQLRTIIALKLFYRPAIWR